MNQIIRKLFLVFILIQAVTNLYSQEKKGIIKGKVVNEITNEPDYEAVLAAIGELAGT